MDRVDGEEGCVRGEGGVVEEVDVDELADFEGGGGEVLDDGGEEGEGGSGVVAILHL